ncbi:unnamed protein product [Cochlearia groenlandica]
MNGASLCNSVLLYRHPLLRLQSSSSSSSSSICLTSSTHISIPHRIRQRFRSVFVKRNDGFRPLAIKTRRNGDSSLIDSKNIINEEEDDDDEDWDDLVAEAEVEEDEEDEDEEDEDEGEFLPMEKMKKWLEKKPRGFGIGKRYETSLEDKLLDEIEQSWKAQAANLNKLKNDPLKPQQLKGNEDNNKGSGESYIGFRVRVTNLPKKKNVHRDLKVAFKEVSGVLNIAPGVSGNKKTKDPVCKGFALVDFKTETDANRFVNQFNGQSLAFGKVVKQMKCQLVGSSSGQAATEELRSDTVFEELPFTGLEVVSSDDVVVVVVDEDAPFESWQESNDDSDSEVDETEVEEDEGNPVSGSVESPIELRPAAVKVADIRRSQKPAAKVAVKREIREREELEIPLVSFQESKSEEAVVETSLDNDDDDDDELDIDVNEEELEPINSAMSPSEEERIDRIRKLELKLLGRESEAKPGTKVDAKEEKKKKKKKTLAKGQGKKTSAIEIPGSSKRLKVKEKALLTGVLVKYAAKAASTSKAQ